MAGKKKIDSATFEEAPAATEAPTSSNLAQDFARGMQEMLKGMQAEGLKMQFEDDAKWYRGSQFTFYVMNPTGAHVTITDIFNESREHIEVYAQGGEDMLFHARDHTLLKHSREINAYLRDGKLVRLTPGEWDAKEEHFEEVKRTYRAVHDRIKNSPYRGEGGIKPLTEAERRKQKRKQEINYPRRPAILGLVEHLKRADLIDEAVMEKVAAQHARRPLNNHERDVLRDNLSELKYPQARKFVMSLANIVTVTPAMVEQNQEKETKFQRAMGNFDDQ